MIAVLFDTETTGLVENRTLRLDKQPEVIEFYGCLVDLSTGEVKKDYEALIRPSRLPIPDKITSITGIYTSQLVDKQPFSAHADAVLSLLSSAPVAIGHNASFDFDMIDMELERLQRPFKWPRLECTVEQTIHIIGRRFTLSALHEHLFGEKFPGAHRAKEDTLAHLRCCVELHKRGLL